VLPDGLVLRARVAVLQIAAAKLGRGNCAGMLLSGIALLLSRVAVLRRLVLPNGVMLSGRAVLRRRRRLLRRQVMSM
jgi:hypothetical protein